MYVDKKSQPETNNNPEDESDEEHKRTIFCANLSEKVTEEILYELFIQAGPVESVHIAKDKDGRQKTFGFVTYIHVCSVPYALELFEGVKLYNQRIVLRPRQPNSNAANNPAKSFVSPSASRFCIENDSRNRGDGKQFSDNSALRMGNFNVLNQRNDSNLKPKETESRTGVHINPFKVDLFARLGGDFLVNQDLNDNIDNAARNDHNSISKHASRNNRGNNRNNPYNRPENKKGGDRGHTGRKRNRRRR